MVSQSDQRDIGSWPAFLGYVMSADIKFVRRDYLMKLVQQGRVWPRRQEAEEEGDSLFQPDHRTEQFRFIAISHMWESREHPDPYGYQLRQIADLISISQVPDNVVFFIDYVSLFQYRRSHSNEEESFRRSMQDMHLLYANSGACFCYQVWSITSLTPGWWKLMQCPRRRVIPAYSEAVDAVQALPLADLKPTKSGRCGETCGERCPNLHANNTPYQKRGWCCAEVEWASPDIIDISNAVLKRRSLWLLRAAVAMMLWQILEGSSLIVGVSLAILLFIALSLCEVLAQSRHPQLGMFPRSKLPLLPSEFQQRASTHGIAFTHRSDADQVVSLQAKVFEQKMRLVHAISLVSLSRSDRQRLPHHILENGQLQNLQLRCCFFDEAEVRSLFRALMDQPLRTIALDSVTLQGNAAELISAGLHSRSWHITSLKLVNCGLRGPAASQLAAAIQGAPCLVEFDISWNRIEDMRAVALATAIATANATDATIQRLHFRGCSISNAGAEAFLPALRQNGKIRHLDLRDNHIRCHEMFYRTVASSPSLAVSLTDETWCEQWLYGAEVFLYLMLALVYFPKAALVLLGMEVGCYFQLRRAGVHPTIAPRLRMRDMKLRCSLLNKLVRRTHYAHIFCLSTYVPLYDRLESAWAKGARLVFMSRLGLLKHSREAEPEPAPYVELQGS